MEAGDSVTLMVYGFVHSDFQGSEVTNPVTLTPPADVGDPILPNSSTVTVPVSREADLELVKSGPARMAPKETIWYTVRVTNKGPSYASNVLISDSVPSQLADVSWNARPSSGRSEERRVGKECVSTGRSRWATCH